MFREVLEFLTGDGWHVAPDTYDGLPCIRTRFDGTEHSWDCRARPYDPFGQLAFESVLPVVVEPDRRDAVARLVVRANWHLLTGAFQLDVDTGELVFRTMVFVDDDAPLPPALVRGLVYSNVLTVDRCLTEFLATADGADADEALVRLAL